MVPEVGVVHYFCNFVVREHVSVSIFYVIVFGSVLFAPFLLHQISSYR